MDYKHAFKKERWIKTAHDDRVYEYHKLEHEDFIVEKNEDEKNDETSKFKRMQSHLNAFGLGNTKNIMNHSILQTDGYKTYTF